jgi:hypothetical protein
MLSHEDQRRLAAIEQQLMSEDPVLAGRLAKHRPGGYVGRRAAAVVLGCLCLLGTIAGYLPGSVLLILLVVVPVGATCYVLFRGAWRGPR